MGLYPPLISKGLGVNPLRRGFHTYALEGCWNRGAPPALAEMIAWYQADKIVGLADGESIVTWPDSTVNGNDLTSGSGKEPTYETLEKNGLPAAAFLDADSDYMKNATPSTTGETDCSLICVVKITLESAYEHIFAGNDGGTMFDFRIEDVAVDNFDMRWEPHEGLGFICSVDLPDATDYHIYYMDYEKNYSGTTDRARLSIDGGSLVTDEITGAAAALTEITFGRSGALGGTANFNIGELILWNKVLSDAERALALAYLNVKWNIY